MQQPTQQPGTPAVVEFEDVPSKPLFTAMLILGAVACYIGSLKREEFYLFDHCWSVARVCGFFPGLTAGAGLGQMLQGANWSSFFATFIYANLSTFNTVHMALSLYFFWVFGAHIEGKLGNGRFLILLLLGATIPWGVLQWDAMSDPKTTFFGPLFLTCAIIGGYLVLPPVPLRKYGGGHLPQQKNLIFKRPDKQDPRAKWIKNPWMFIGVFLVSQIFFHFWCVYGIPNPMVVGGFLLPPLGKDFDTFRLLPAIVGLGCGWAVASFAVRSAGQAYKQGPMVVNAIKRYHELLDLDVQPDEAIRGTARTLGLSYEKTRDIIRKNKDKLRIK